jgi:hypothetical protein
MRTTAVLGGATASAGLDQLQLTESRGSINSRSKQGSQLGTADMMRRMMVPLAGHPSGSPVHASDGGFAGALLLLPWPGRKGW